MLEITAKVRPRLVFRKEASGQSGFLNRAAPLHISLHLFLPEPERPVCGRSSQLALEVSNGAGLLMDAQMHPVRVVSALYPSTE